MLYTAFVGAELIRQSILFMSDRKRELYEYINQSVFVLHTLAPFTGHILGAEDVNINKLVTENETFQPLQRFWEINKKGSMMHIQTRRIIPLLIYSLAIHLRSLGKPSERKEVMQD